MTRKCLLTQSAEEVVTEAWLEPIGATVKSHQAASELVLVLWATTSDAYCDFSLSENQINAPPPLKGENPKQPPAVNRHAALTPAASLSLTSHWLNSDVINSSLMHIVFARRGEHSFVSAWR